MPYHRYLFTCVSLQRGVLGCQLSMYLTRNLLQLAVVFQVVKQLTSPYLQLKPGLIPCESRQWQCRVQAVVCKPSVYQWLQLLQHACVCCVALLYQSPSSSALRGVFWKAFQCCQGTLTSADFGCPSSVYCSGWCCASICGHLFPGNHLAPGARSVQPGANQAFNAKPLVLNHNGRECGKAHACTVHAEFLLYRICCRWPLVHDDPVQNPVLRVARRGCTANWIGVLL